MTRILVVVAAMAVTMTAQPIPSQSAKQPESKKTPATSQPAKPAKQPAAKAKAKAKTAPSKAAKWLLDTFGIDLQAYATLTGIRGGDGPRTGARLVAYDVRNQTEATLWECGACWSPVMTGESIALLRTSSEPAGKAEIWIVSADATRRRVGEALDLDTVLVGVRDGTIYAATSDARCAAGGAAHRLIAVDSRSGAVSDVPEPLCVRTAAVPRPDRVWDDKIVATVPAQKAGGVTEPRRFYVLAPATSARPVATMLKLPPDKVDRFDPIWGGSDRVIYVARP